MSEIAITLTINGVTQELVPERIVDNLGVPYITARDYLKDLGIIDVDKMSDIEVSENMYNVYCKSSPKISNDNVFPTTITSGYTYYEPRPYPFGNKAVLDLAVCAYYEEEKSTGLLPKGECVASGGGSQIKSDTDVSLSYRLDVPAGKKFNKIKIGGKPPYDTNNGGLSTVTGNVIWGKTSVFNPSVSNGHMTYYVDGAYYMFYHTTSSTGGLYAYGEDSLTVDHINSLDYEDEEGNPIKKGSLYYGGILDDMACLFTTSSLVWKDGEIEAHWLKETNTSYNYGMFKINVASIFGDSYFRPVHIYGHSNSWYFLLGNSETHGKVLLLKTTSGGFVYHTLPSGNDPYVAYTYITMIDKVVYMCIRRYQSSSGLIDIYILKPNTGSFDTATDFDIIDTGLKSANNVYPCNNGKWYLGNYNMNGGKDFDDKGFLVEFKPGLPIFEIDLKEPVEVPVGGTCSLKFDITIKPNSKE